MAKATGKKDKARKGSIDNPIEEGHLSNDGIAQLPGRKFMIMSASVVDEYCDYSVKITEGVGVSNTAKWKGTHVVKEDMVNAFRAFHVHLAMLDSAFKAAKVECKNIDDLKVHEITLDYRVHAFQIKGDIENQSISLIGTKYSSVAQGWFNTTTPFIPISENSFYQWYNELKAVTDIAREEVALYHEGKYREDEEDLKKVANEKKKQKTIFDKDAAADNSEADETGSGSAIDDEDFAEAAR